MTNRTCRRNPRVRKLEFLAAMWPKEHLALLAPRAALLCEGTAFKKVALLGPDKLKTQDLSSVQLLVTALGGAWGQTALEKSYASFAKAIYGTIAEAWMRQFTPYLATMWRLVPMAWMPLRTGFSAPIILMCSAWLLSVLTRKACARPCQGSDLQMALSLLASQLCVRIPWLTLLRRSSDLQFQWGKRRYHLCTGSGFSLLVSLSVSPNAGLRMVVVRVVLPAGLCLVSQTTLLVCAMLGQTLLVQLDFCRKSFSDSVPLTKLPHCRMRSYNLLCVASDTGLGFTRMQSGINAWRSLQDSLSGNNLLRILAEISNDPDSAFTDQLAAGVSLGVQCHLQPCAVMAPGLPPDVDPRPLECCASAWQSALSDLPAVDNLIQEELQQGWIKEVTGGLPALRQQYSLCALGKLGLVHAPGRPPRLRCGQLCLCRRGEHCAP